MWSSKEEQIKAIVNARLACMLDSLGTIPHAFIVADPSVSYGSMGIQLIYKNTALSAHLNDSNADAKIAEVIAAFTSRELPFAWWVDDTSTPSDLEARLIRHGLYKDPEDDYVPGMVFDLTKPVPNLPHSSSEFYEVRRVSTAAEYAAYCDVCVRANDGDEDYRRQRALLGTLGFEESRAAWHYVAWMRKDTDSEKNSLKAAQGGNGSLVSDDKGFVAVATCTAFAAPQCVLGLYNINVVPEARRRGFGSAVTLKAMRDAVASRGSKLAVLEASTNGEKLYKSLGFETVITWRIYLKPYKA